MAAMAHACDLERMAPGFRPRTHDNDECPSHVVHIPGLLSPSECAQIIAATGGKFGTSTVEGYSTHATRTSRTWHAPSVSYFPWLIDRIESVLPSYSRVHFEKPQVTRYEPGQFYAAHYDTLDEPGPQGQRVATVLVYLNTVVDGGATHFPHLGQSHHPVCGDVVIFFPAHADGTKNPDLLHEAQRVNSGLKYVLQVWVRRFPAIKSD